MISHVDDFIGHLITLSTDRISRIKTFIPQYPFDGFPSSWIVVRVISVSE